MNKTRYLSVVLLLISFAVLFGYCVCYQHLSGSSATVLFTSLFTERQESVTIPSDLTPKTFEEARQVVREAAKNNNYGSGYNCLDYAWTGMRALNWDGQPAAIAGILYEKGKGHALILTLTEDKGWVLIDAETSIEVRPTVGKYLKDGKKVASIQILVLHWVDIDDFVKNPQIEVQE